MEIGALSDVGEAARIEARDQRIRRLAACGIPPNEIGWRVGLQSRDVILVLNNQPLALNPLEAGDLRATGHSEVHPMWGWGEQERRQAFIERYRQGIRDTLAGKFYGR